MTVAAGRGGVGSVIVRSGCELFMGAGNQLFLQELYASLTAEPAL